MNIDTKKWMPVIVAVIVALIAGAWYTTSGRSSFDQNLRELTKDKEITEINATNPERIAIECKNGEKYEIMFSNGQPNYEDLIFNACGEDGAVE